VEGFGNVGTFAAQFLEKAGARIVATSDSKGTVYNPNGLLYEKLVKAKKESGSVTNYGNGSKVLPTQGIIHLPVDILVTAAVPDLVHTRDVDAIKAKLIVEGSNIPMTEQTEEFLHHKKVMVVPDFVANAGGVISSFVEYTGGSKEEMFKLVEKKVSKNTKTVLEQSKKTGEQPRKIAMEIAKKRVLKKCKICHVELPERK
jgi:glutamate dehydrogenase/leucine dehydrogenase